MKRIVCLLTISLIFFAGCTGVRTVSTGLENESFLEFIGNPKDYSNGVDVNIDDKVSFNAKVKKDYATRPKGEVYAIPAGSHVLTVSYNSKEVYKKQIFISAQETKKIILP
ncbi:MAG: hypothetical protein LBH34_02040 [Prevotellaceae bacterium]|jgi:hypothetical protein|nr:hypothetical protein [Prevotellaceae bacterium]